MISNRGGNIYRLPITFKILDPLLQEYGRHVKTTGVVSKSVKPIHRRGKDTHLFAVTFAPYQIFVGERRPVHSHELVL